MTLGVQHAVAAASNYLSSLQGILGFEQIEGLRLEEVELSEDKQYWLITLGFNRPMDKMKNPLTNLMTVAPYEREYKVFKVNAQTGEVQSMKIREL